MRLAARCNAKLGDNSKAQRLLEDSFAQQHATDEDRIEILSWLGHVESGYFSGHNSQDARTRNKHLELDLRRFAQTLGFSISWNEQAKSVEIPGVKTRGTISARTGSTRINGRTCSGVAVIKNGRSYVSPSVVATPMAEQKGRGVARALSGLLVKGQ